MAILSRDNTHYCREWHMKKLVSIIAVAVGAAAVLAPAASAAGGWSAVSVPSTGNNVVLLGASARTNSDAWAVGQQFVGAGKPPAPAVTYQWHSRTRPTARSAR